MTTRVEALTDKEKEALRLLLAGHDAKSSATELGISVHTMNDRLRSARRKMHVSSSREAARILGDAEAATPQNIAHMTIGMAESAVSADPAILNEPRHFGPSRSMWLTGGMLIMSILIAAAVVGAAYVSGTPASTAHTPPEVAADAEPAAEQAASLGEAEAFLAAVDALDWEASWVAAGEYFQSQATLEEWEAVISPVRTPLGNVTQRTIATVQRASTLPGAPEGEYEVLQFSTVYSGRERPAVETVIMLETGNGWSVAGYFVN